ncbi:MAG: hypothetical protein RMY64_12385 [Nostoc sp. DedQUE08]|uniref:hypothetical protein n=1 Tax=unclassified Nostoc TaxID=2593658 RepID=UPI002AD54F2D|nr:MULTISPECIES: hypothetical protein [unclassified Nostoc]MDZ8032303.1 hypothetical protein [Nostoc sp. DedSLP04]MDZ8066420.1 hypothetical protein [Nostoc sp. DedQUE08]
MLKQTENVRIKIFRSIFAAVNLALISGGLVSCVVEAPQPLAPIEQQKPELQPNQNDKDDDHKDDDRKNDQKDGDRKNNKQDDDKDDND